MFLRTLKMQLSYDPATSLLRIYRKKTKTLMQEDIHTLMFAAALLGAAQISKQPRRPPVDEWTKGTCAHMQYRVPEQ